MKNQNENLLAAFGEILLRLDCPAGQRFQRNRIYNRFYGGAEANVSVVLSQLGIRTRYVTALPLNKIGQAAIDEMLSFGMDTAYIHRSGERVGIYFTEHGNNIRASRVIYDRKNSSFASLQIGMINWEEVFINCTYFFWSGISSALTKNAANVCREALSVARSKGLIIAADMNYRRTLWDYGKQPSEVMPELLSQCEIITGDIDTIAVYFGIVQVKGSNEEQFRFCATELKKKLTGMKIFAMTFRGTDKYNQPTYSGALMSGNEFYFSPVYSLPQSTDRIGSGDAFQGGLLYGIMKKMPGPAIINFAIACGAIKHSIAGDFTLLTKEEAEEFIKSGPVNRIIR